MNNVINLDEARPHLSGKARCLDCKHEWEAVAPLGATWLQCPGCSLFRGRFIGEILRDKLLHYTCNCGNDLFYVTLDGTYCPNCGEWIIL
jgi:Zn finger protein HypA/HybF involved in hydrogenase expression